jgi:hypothetical protein
MQVHPMAKYINDKETYEQMKRFVDTANATPEIEFTIDEKKLQRDMDRAIKKALDKCFK